MSIKVFNLIGVVGIVAVSACSQPEPQRPVISPVYDKVGNVVACVGSDGQDYPVPTAGADYGSQGRQNPCDPVCDDPQYSTATGEWVCRQPPGECEDGFYNQAGQWVCREDDDGDGGPDIPDPQIPDTPTTGGGQVF